MKISEPPGQVLQLGDRLQPVLSEDHVAREAAAAEAAEAERGLEYFNAGKLEHRARAINGALNTFDFVLITGREFWQIYGRSPARETFFPWALKAQAAVNDIVAEHQRLFPQEPSAE
jgi:hypothetical protein